MSEKPFGEPLESNGDEPLIMDPVVLGAEEEQATLPPSTGKTKASGLLAATKIFAFVLQLIGVRFQFQWLGESQYGLFIVVQVWSAFLVFLDPSLSIGAQKRLTEALARNDKDETRRIFSFQVIGNSIVGLIGATALTVGGGLVVYFSHGGHDSPSMALVTLVAGMYLCTYLLGALSAMLAGSELFSTLAAIGSAQTLLSTAFSLAMVYKYRTVEALAAGTTLGFVIPIVVSATICKGRFTPGSWTFFDRTTANDVFRLSFRSYWNRISSVLASRSDRLVIGGNAAKDLAVYAIACRVPEVLCDVLSSVTVTSLPELTRAHSHDSSLFSRLIARNAKLQLSIACSFILLPAAFGHSILKVWLGQRVTHADTVLPPHTDLVLLYIGIYRTFELLYIGYTSAFYAMGQPQKMFKFAAFNAITTVLVSYPAYHFGGIVGIGLMNAAIDIIQFVPITLTLIHHAAKELRPKPFFIDCGVIFGSTALVAYFVHTYLDGRLLRGHEVWAVLVAPIVCLAWIAVLCATRLCPMPDPVYRLARKVRLAMSR